MTCMNAQSSDMELAARLPAASKYARGRQRLSDVSDGRRNKRQFPTAPRGMPSHNRSSAKKGWTGIVHG
jgi:hypothetical protein